VDPGYDDYHAPRYAFLIRLLRELGATTNATLLDVGRSTLTARLREEFHIPVDSIGFGPDETNTGGRHFEFDLNLAQSHQRWRTDLPAYRFVVMAEVLEHLHTAPQLVLAFVVTVLAKDGLLIVQTPNAAAVTKRVKLLLGRNPYEMLRPDLSDPGHYREYTVAELRQIGKGLGLREERCLTGFYFDARFARHGPNGVYPQPVIGAIKNALYPLLPKSFREGITMVWRKN